MQCLGVNFARALRRETPGVSAAARATPMDLDLPAVRRASPEVVEIMDSDDDEQAIAGPADLIQLMQLTWMPLQTSPARAEISCVINHLVSFQCVICTCWRLM